MSGFERNARTVSLLTLLSRITGLARDAVVSRVFGAAALTDAFFFAFLVPNLFRRLFGEGALAAAFLPVYTRCEENDPKQARALATLVVGRTTVLLGAIVLVCEAVLFALSARTDHENLALWLTMITLPYMPLVCLLAIFGAMLQVHGRFGPAASAPIILNALMIAAVAGLPLLGVESRSAAHAGGAAGAVVLAGCVQVTWALLALRSQPWWAGRGATLHGREPLRDVLAQAVPMIVGLGVLQLNTLFDGLIASYPTAVGPTILGRAYPLDQGAMACVSFAQRLYQFPLGVFGIAVATAVFPLLARQANSPGDFTATVRRGLRLVVFIGVPASVGLMLVREPMTRVILEGGDFDADDTARVGRVLLGYAPAIWAYSMTHVLARAFYARREARTPVRIALGVVGLNLALNCVLIWTPLREAGLAYSTAICAVIQVTLLTATLARRLGAALIDRTVLVSWTKTAVATGLMAAALAAVGLDAPDSWRGALGVLALAVGGGAMLYALAAVVLRMPELRWALGRS